MAVNASYRCGRTSTATGPLFFISHFLVPLHIIYNIRALSLTTVNPTQLLGFGSKHSYSKSHRTYIIFSLSDYYMLIVDVIMIHSSISLL